MLTAPRVSPVFYQAVRCLRKKLPAAYPVRVRTVEKLAGRGLQEGDNVGVTLGSCRFSPATSKKPAYFSITIARGPETVMIDALLEEVAHALAWSHRHDVEDEPNWHGPEWGVAYAEVVRTWRGVK